MIDSFKLQESCYGKYIEINDTDIFDVYYSQENIINEFKQAEDKLKHETLDLLLKNINKLDVMDWEKIIGIVAYHEGFNYEHDTGTMCDCCGSYDETTKYTRDDSI